MASNSSCRLEARSFCRELRMPEGEQSMIARISAASTTLQSDRMFVRNTPQFRAGLMVTIESDWERLK